MSGKEGPRRSTRIRNQQFLESNSTTNHAFQLLPAEIRAEIFNKISQPEVGILRLVCKQWAEDIKTDYNYAVKFKEDSPQDQLRHILQLRIVNLGIKKIAENQIPRFKYPGLIRRMLIGHEMSPNSVNAFLQLCQTTLTDLKIKINPQFLVHEFPVPSTYNFQELKRLNLRLGVYPKSPQSVKKNRASVCSNFRNSSFPNLKMLKVKLLLVDSMNTAEHIDTTKRNTAAAVAFILKLVTKNPTGLESLTIQSKHFKGPETRALPAITTFAKLSIDDLKVLKSVRKLKSIDFSLNGADKSNEELLFDLIERQECLEKIQLAQGLPYYANLLKSMTLNNQETLVSIEINRLDLDEDDGPFDLSVFKTCSRLQTLELAGTKQPFTSGPQVINLYSLPESLRSLCIRSLDILSEDLLVFVRSEVLLQNLEQVNFFYSRHDGDFGFNLSLLEKILDLECRSLESFEMAVNWGTEAEAPQRREILKKLELTRQPFGFSLSLFRDEFNRLRHVPSCRMYTPRPN